MCWEGAGQKEGDTLRFRGLLALVQGEQGPESGQTAPGYADLHCKSPVPWGLEKQFHSSHSRHVLESEECSHFVCITHLQLMQVI